MGQVFANSQIHIKTQIVPVRYLNPKSPGRSSNPPGGWLIQKDTKNDQPKNMRTETPPKETVQNGDQGIDILSFRAVARAEPTSVAGVKSL